VWHGFATFKNSLVSERGQGCFCILAISVPFLEDCMHDKQLTGNIGLFYACYQLSLHGWNALPTIRNARGADIILVKSKKKLGIQVKALSSEADIFLGKNYDDPSVEYWVVLMNVRQIDKQMTYVIPQKDINQGVKVCEQGINSSENLIYHDVVKIDGKISYYINRKFLKNINHIYADAWQSII
jgi:hypothetical protein